MDNKTNRLTFMGVMLALTIAFVVITIVPSASASMAVVMFLPTILTGIVYGAGAGTLMGFCAGFATLLRALLMPLSPLDPFFLNPLVSVLPRMCIGIMAALIYRLVKKAKLGDIASSAVAAAMGMVTNTVLVIGMLYLVKGQDMVEMMGGGFAAVLGAIFLSNGLLEVVSAVIIIPIVYSAYIKHNKISRD